MRTTWMAVAITALILAPMGVAQQSGPYKILKKAKTAPEPKATPSKKQRLDTTSSVEPKVDETDEAPSTPSVSKWQKI